MKKIFYIYTALLTVGGADRVITNKANWLAEHGYDVSIITDTQMGRPPVYPLSSRVKLHDLAINFEREYNHCLVIRILWYFILMWKYKRAMKKILFKERPDIVVSTLGRDLDFLTSINDGSIKVGEAHTTKCHLRNLHLMEQRGGLYWLFAKYMRWKMCYSVSKLDALVLLTQTDADDWKGITKTFVIPNPISFYPEEAAKLDKKQVILVGRYNDAKGYDYLIPAWEIVHQCHPDWILNVYGSGELRDDVIRWVKERNLEKTIILNDPTDHIMEKYLESSLCVLSSRYEGFSLVILEAMSCGVPVISFDCPHGPRNIIINGEDGVLIEYLNAQALADGICRLIENEDFRKYLGANARTNILRFSKENVMNCWEMFFNKWVYDYKKYN